jgi:hypothetical protein
MRKIIKIKSVENSIQEHLHCIFMLVFVAFSLATISLTSGCGDDMITDSSQIVFPDSNVSFRNTVQPYLQLSCSYLGCHSEETMAGGRRITDWYTLFEAANTGLIIPNKPDNSVLCQMLEGKITHTNYPYWKINDNQKKGIRKWVLEGAKNN